MSLKRCPLCGAVNALSNSECFVCSWAGRFDTDPEMVDEGLGELLIRCPELADAMLQEPVKQQSKWERLKESLTRMFRRERPGKFLLDF